MVTLPDTNAINQSIKNNTRRAHSDKRVLIHSSTLKYVCLISLLALSTFMIGCGSNYDERNTYVQHYNEVKDSNPCKQYGLDPLQAYSTDGRTITMICYKPSPFTRRDVTVYKE